MANGDRVTHPRSVERFAWQPAYQRRLVTLFAILKRLARAWVKRHRDVRDLRQRLGELAAMRRGVGANGFDHSQCASSGDRVGHGATITFEMAGRSKRDRRFDSESGTVFVFCSTASRTRRASAYGK